MKKPSLKAILTAFLMIAPFHGQSSASVASPTEGISQIELIKGKSYDPRTEEGRGFRQFFSGIAVAFAGPNINLEKKIQERLERPDLKIYFPSPLERERIGKAIANEVRSKILSHGYSNETVLLSLRKITESLVKKIISRIMEKEGITNPGRAAA